MKVSSSNIRCPACQGALQPTVLSCTQCELRVEGRFEMNEFATLSPEDLHFLRIFIHSEGRIREMESALGLSYPTIRARLSDLKKRLVGAPVSAPAVEPVSPRSVLEQLERGEIDYEQALEELQKKPRKPRQNPGQKEKP